MVRHLATTLWMVPPGLPHVLLSVAVSVDGFIDDTSPSRLVLSGEADLDRVDEVRAGVDAVLVGAGTLRTDDPRLLVRSAARRSRRVARGHPEHPIKVTVTGSGNLDPGAAFFTTGDTRKIVYAAGPAVGTARERLDGVAEVVDAGTPLDLRRALADLATRGVHRLLVEGGSSVLTQFLRYGLADELHLAVAPFFVGDPTAPRFVGPGAFPYGPGRRMHLLDSRVLDDVVLLRYRLAPC